MSSAKILEIACFSLEAALLAESAGADRIELCENYAVGGITPSHHLIKEVRRKLGIPVHAIIRPRAGDFVYSKEEIDIMVKDIIFCKEQGIHGIVLGALTTENKIDVDLCADLIRIARPMSVTFHRAIDQCEDIDAAFETLITLGVDRVLTSAGKGNAVDHVLQLTRLQKEYGSKITVMPGGGVRYSNLREFLHCGCREFHTSAIRQKEIADAGEIRRIKDFLEKSL